MLDTTQKILILRSLRWFGFREGLHKSQKSSPNLGVADEKSNHVRASIKGPAEISMIFKKFNQKPAVSSNRYHGPNSLLYWGWSSHL